MKKIIRSPSTTVKITGRTLSPLTNTSTLTTEIPMKLMTHIVTAITTLITTLTTTLITTPTTILTMKILVRHKNHVIVAATTIPTMNILVSSFMRHLSRTIATGSTSRSSTRVSVTFTISRGMQMRSLRNSESVTTT